MGLKLIIQDDSIIDPFLTINQGQKTFYYL